MNEPTIQITGTACADSEIRYTPTGKPVTHVTVACNPRRYDQASGQWLDGTATFWPCQIWGGAAEHVAESVKKGDRVILTGRVKANVWTPTDGEHAGVEQRRLDLIVEEIGLSLRFHPARSDRSRGTNSQADTSEAPY